jgi:protease I
MRLAGKKIAYLVDEGFEDLEFWVPVMRLREEGAQVRVVGTKLQTYRGKHCLEARPDVLAGQVDPDEFDALVVPGGWAPDKLRRNQDVLALVQGIYKQGKTVAAICHAGWVLASAGIVRGHKATGSMGIRDDMINAGAEWVDQPALRDGNLVWGRVVEDIPDFCRELVAALEEAV